MITNSQYKIFASQIAKLFCPTDTICQASVKERILFNFNNESFSYFLQNISVGRFKILQYSNWRVKQNNCRTMLIDVKLTDAITGEVKTGYWSYDNRNCGSEQYYFPDLNSLIRNNGYTLVDAPIMSKNNSDIVKPRLVHAKSATGYGITYVPPSPGGGGGGISVTPPVQTPPAQIPPVQTPSQSGFNIQQLIKPEYALIGIAALAAYMFFMKK
jgi:hypothetical protein